MASITCAKCKGTHDSVRLVRACHEGRLGLTMSLTDCLNGTPVFCADCAIHFKDHVREDHEAASHPKACAKAQYELELVPLLPLATEANGNWTGTWAEWVALYRTHRDQQIPGLPGVTVGSASAFKHRVADDQERVDREWTPQEVVPGAINPRSDGYPALQELRKQVRARMAELVPGHDCFRVALRPERGQQKLHFYKIDIPQRGRWANHVFIKEQASDALHRVRGVQYEAAILRQFLADPQAALKTYGDALEQCGLCGRTLTDEESRARGIGPICADKMIGV